MAKVFISHAGADTSWAEQVHLWLKEDGHEVFLDRDRTDGILLGEEWERRLYTELRMADAVVCIVTESYLKSAWCTAEIGAARALGTELLPVRFSPVSERHSLLRPIHEVDAARDPSEARERLRSRLSVIDGGGGWGWPDDRSPYPGLRSFDLGEHRVFFGRNREITQIAERLRSPERAERAILTVVGASGCGKSSFVRAGLLPRIAGEDYWLPVPPILPGTDPLGNLVRAIAALTQEQHISYDVTTLRSGLDRDGLKAIATDLLLAAGNDSRCKLLIVIDQFEELLTQTAHDERAEFVAALAPALGGPVQALATLRPEFLEPLAKDPDVSQLSLRMHQIRPLDSDALRSVIEEPAKVAGLGFDEDLVTRLVSDTGGGEALPLLAFTLEQLAHGVTRGGRLTHQRYTEIGGVQGALQRQADAALDEACAKTGVTRDQVISELLDLATIDDEGRPTRRRIGLDEFSSTVRAELQPFVDRRLLTTEAEGERTQVGVAHEAFLVNWPPLKDAIDAQAVALRARRVVESAANDWVAGGRDGSALLQGRQLTRATVDIGAELELVVHGDGSTPTGSKPKWWPGERQLVTRVDLHEAGRAFLEASIRTDQARRRRRVIQVVGVIAILAVTTLTAGVGFIRANEANAKAHQRLTESTALRLVSEGQAMLADIQDGGHVRAINQILAAQKIADRPDERGVLDTLQATLDQLKIIDTGAEVYDLAVSTDGQRIMSTGSSGLSKDSTVTFWDTRTGHVTATFPGVAFSPDGSRVVSISDDQNLQVRDTQTGQPVGPATPGGYPIAFSPDAQKIVGQSPDSGFVWEIESGKVIPMVGSQEIRDAVFASDGRRLVTSDSDGAIRVWDAESGVQLLQPISLGLGSSLALSGDGRRLITEGELSNGIRIWDLETGRLIAHGEAHEPIFQNYVTSLALSRDGLRVVTGSTDHTVQIWDAETAAPVGGPLIGHRNDVADVAFSADGEQVISGSADKTIRVWKEDPSNMLGEPITGAIRANVTISPDGRRILWYGDGAINIWDAQTFTPVLPPMEAESFDFALSRDGSRIASVDATSVTVWDANTGARLNEWSTGQDLDRLAAGITVSPDGRKIATYGGTVDNIGPDQKTDMGIVVWDAESGEQIGPPVDQHTMWVSSAAFSPDSRYLAYNKDMDVRVVEVESGEAFNELSGAIGPVSDLAYRPDGRQLLVADDKTMRLLDSQSGEIIAEVTDTDEITAPVFSADGKYIISSHGTDLRIWDADARQAIGDLTGGSTHISSFAISDDNRRIVADNLGFDDAEGSWSLAGIWPGPAAWPDLLCAKLTHNLSDKQWNEWVEPTIPYRAPCPDLPKASDQESH